MTTRTVGCDKQHYTDQELATQTKKTASTSETLNMTNKDNNGRYRMRHRVRCQHELQSLANRFGCYELGLCRSVGITPHIG